MSTDTGLHSVATAIDCTILYTGGGQECRDSTRRILNTVFSKSGLRGVALMVKGWSKSVRALMSRTPFDTTCVGYCKKARNCRYRLRKAGLNEFEISQFIQIYDNICGIPPILLDRHYVRGLLPNPRLFLVKRVLPFGNISRACPIADARECDESLRKFFQTTSLQWSNQFDFSVLSIRYGMKCSSSVPRFSKWETSSSSSFDYSRSEGGKMCEIIDKVVNDFIYRPIDDFVPTRPNVPLLDIFGNVALYPEDWISGTTLVDSLYQESADSPLDQRFGLFGILWAVSDLRTRYGNSVSSDSEYFLLGETRPRIRFHTSVLCRVVSVPEEGWKARVVTITPLSVAMLQIVLRHVLDPFVRRDPLISIGLLSKVKLYDVMVNINLGDKVGLDDDGIPSFFYSCCESVDLTTATDSPYRLAVSSILVPFTKTVLKGELEEFSDLVLDLALSDRILLGSPSGWSHKCGIMMGEAMSGVFLNVMSAIVRNTIEDLMVEFDYYAGFSNDDADDFISGHHDLIQNWLSEVQINEFEPLSSQSGDDMVKFNMHQPIQQSRFLILMYRIIGMIPSGSTFYSSEYLGTFTEEFCYKNQVSNGWTFVDIIKPRLFLPVTSDDLDSILSRIKQMSNTLKYSTKDIDLVYRVSEAVDLLLSSNRVISDRIKRYSIVKEFPSFLGGLEHPAQFLPDAILNVPDEDKNYICKLASCTEEEFLEIKYHWIFEERTGTGLQVVRDLITRIYNVFTQLEVGTGVEIHPMLTYAEGELLDRNSFPSYRVYKLELDRLKTDLGLANLDEIIQDVAAGFKLKCCLLGEETVKKNPLILLRNRREFLISKAQALPDSGAVYSPGLVGQLDWRFKSSFRGLVTQKTEFLECLGLGGLPLLTIPI